MSEQDVRTLIELIRKLAKEENPSLVNYYELRTLAVMAADALEGKEQDE